MIDLLLLYLLYDNTCTIYGLKKAIDANYPLFFKVSFGSIQPALIKLEEKKFINVEKNITDGGKRISKYSITDEGKKHFHAQMLNELPKHPTTAEQIINAKLIALSKENTSNKVLIIKEIIKHYELAKLNAEKALKRNKFDGYSQESLTVSHIFCCNEKIRTLTNLLNKNSV